MLVFFFLAKMTRRQVGWICRLDVVLISDNLFFFFVAHNLSLWQQMVLLWTPKLPAIHCVRMSAIKILMPSACPPYSWSPCWFNTNEKYGKFSAPDQVISRRTTQLEQQTALVGRLRPTMVGSKFRDDALKKTLFHTEQVHKMSNKLITRHLLCN